MSSSEPRTATRTPTTSIEPSIDIAAMTEQHAEAVLAIYQQGIDTGDATFETSAPTWSAFDAGKLADQRHVALDRDDRTVLGWIAASAVSSRAVYAGVVEHSVYVRTDVHGRGVGRALLDHLIRSTEAAGIWTIQTGVFPENEISLSLHVAAGFRRLGVRKRVGCHYGKWRDVILLERRSAVAGQTGPGASCAGDPTEIRRR